MRAIYAKAKVRCLVKTTLRRYIDEVADDKRDAIALVFGSQLFARTGTKARSRLPLRNLGANDGDRTHYI